MTLPPHRPYSQWLLEPVHNPALGYGIVSESASVPLILETLSTYAEIANVGRRRYNGTIAQRNAMWRHARNYLQQAMSNFAAAQSVPNRSAALLYYYSMLNFAKVELLGVRAADIVNTRVGHGLSFSPTAAKTVTGDRLKVVDGLFPMLYEYRTGRSLRKGATLPISRLLQQVPEIGSQVQAVTGMRSQVTGVLQMLAADATHSWILLAIPAPEVLGGPGTASRRLLDKHFQAVAPPAAWRDHFALSRRYPGAPKFFEAKSKEPLIGEFGSINRKTFHATWSLKDILGLRTHEEVDAWVAPSLYRSKLLPMPPSLARYALTYYASSLVRYKLQMFDARSMPEQAYLFDAIARELALPMLQDVLTAVEGQPTYFYAASSYRR